MKRTKQEQIEYFRFLAHGFEVDAHREKDEAKKNYFSGKAEAYKMAAFELERNMG